ncbi:MAG: hypothetical protein JSR55_11380 [Proteobacteria bacterium]|nr:hypothetical protein [Pseudomonadota bacterium]
MGFSNPPSALTMIMLPAPFAAFGAAFPNACAEMELAAAATPIAKISRLLPLAICTPIYVWSSIVLGAATRRNLIRRARVAAMRVAPCKAFNSVCI